MTQIIFKGSSKKHQPQTLSSNVTEQCEWLYLGDFYRNVESFRAMSRTRLVFVN